MIRIGRGISPRVSTDSIGAVVHIDTNSDRLLGRSEAGRDHKADKRVRLNSLYELSNERRRIRPRLFLNDLIPNFLEFGRYLFGTQLLRQ